MVDEKSLRLYRNETICLDLKKNNNNQNDFALPQKCSVVGGFRVHYRVAPPVVIPMLFYLNMAA